MKISILFILSVVILNLSSCQTNKLDIDVSKIELDVKIHRFDKDLHAINIENLITEVPKLESKTSRFFELYTSSVLKIGTTAERDFFFRLKDFLTHPDWTQVYDSINHKFDDLSELEDELTDAFKHYKYYYPDKEIPEIYTCMSGFNYAVFTDENILGIGLDFYLGKDSKFYAMAQFPDYQKYNMASYKITSDCFQAIAQTDFEYNDSINNLISQMVYQGKIQYFMHAMLPQEKDSVLFGYTQVQTKWAFSYEDKIWAFMVEQKHLFSDESLMIKKYIEASPFTSYFTNNSAPRLGVFIGWRIVNSFMENNQDVSLPELMAMDDYQYILNNSSYNP